MAVFYNKEKSKLGTLTGSIISFSTKLETNEPTDANNKKLLPSGYIRCDGSVYSANIYPLLAEVLGTGDNCKFKKSTNSLRNDQFQVPDLLVKHIRASTGANVGDLNDLYYESSTGTTLTKSGIGLDVLSNIDPVYTLSYTGNFYLPSVTVDLRGEPSFTRTTGGSTEYSDIPSNGIIPHAHFSTTVRSRTKNYAGTNTADTQNNYNRRPTTLDVCSWYKNTYQGLCQNSAETAGGYSSAVVRVGINTSNAWKFKNMCISTCRFQTSSGGASCLIPAASVACESCVYTFEYPVQYSIYAGDYGSFSRTLCPGDPGQIKYTNTGYFDCFRSGFFSPIVSACTFFPPDPRPGQWNVPAAVALAGTYTYTTVPFSVGNGTGDVGYMGINNISTRTTDVGNDGNHRHTVGFNAERNTYQVRTTAQTFPAEGLTSTISVKTTTEKKADNYIQPYVVVEYLIKV